MSKPTHPPIKRGLAAWPRWSWLALIVLVIVAFGVVYTVQQPSGTPQLQIDETTLDFGDVRYGSPVRAVFTVQNNGDAPLRILEQPIVEVVQGCCPPPVILTTALINPGETGTVAFQFSMHEGMGGQHEFLVRLRTNDPAQPETQLRVFSNWIA